MKITSTRSAQAEQGLKILTFGGAGAGKTYLCSTTGDLEHTLILSAEAGLLSLREFDIDVVNIDTMDTLREVYMALRNGQTEKTYTWVCLDSISEIAETCLEYEMTQTANGLKAYGEMAKTMGKLIRLFRDLPGVNVYMSAKQERIEGGDLQLIWAPMLPGKKLSQGIAYWFDEVFALRTRVDEDGNDIRKLQTVNDGAFECKDRSGALDKFEECDLAAIAQKIANHTTNQDVGHEAADDE